MNKLKNARKEKKLTLRALASLVGVSRQAILDYERLKYPPKDIVWKRLKDVLDLPGEFFDYFEYAAGTGGRNMQYTEDSICAFAGCKERPIAKGCCRRHYNKLYRDAK